MNPIKEHINIASNQKKTDNDVGVDYEESIWPTKCAITSWQGKHSSYLYHKEQKHKKNQWEMELISWSKIVTQQQPYVLLLPGWWLITK